MMNDQFFRRTAQQTSSPKVISVPVHFISSDKPRMTLSVLKDSAAITIQRVFRGFLVRKSVKKIASIRNDVGEIERRIGDIQVVDMIRTDAKERLRVNETLMSLLFKLDSIRGVDSGIRDLRKAVTKKAIGLQEKVDSMANQTLDSPNDESIKIDGSSEAVEDGSGVVKENIADCKDVKAADRCDLEGLSEMKKEDDGYVEGSMEMQQKINNDEENREEFEKLMVDNEKMMKLMSHMFERNEMQTRMINLLSRRVEQLEKAFMTTDRMRRKNKKTQHVDLKRRRRDKDNFCKFSGNNL